MTRLDRALGILLVLSGGATASSTELARRFEVSVRTIYRDILVLESVGVPIVAVPGAGGGYRLSEGYFLPPIAFKRDEAISLMLALTLLSSLRVTPFAVSLEEARRKLVAALPARLQSALSEAQRLIAFEGVASDAFHPEKDQALTEALASEVAALDVFLRALFDGHTVKLEYDSPYRDGLERLEAIPLGVLWDRDRWYLIGQQSGQARMRNWRADRVTQAERYANQRQAIAGFDVRTLLERRWLESAMKTWIDSSPVRIRMTAIQAQRLQGDWYYRHAQFETQADVTVMTYGENDAELAMNLVRWLGPGAELLEPEAWRERMRLDLQAMLEAHG
jgi:predicted DNA-binding transcriptional regulator YafY